MDQSGGLGGFRQTAFGIVPSGKEWKCYQTKQLYSGGAYLREKDSLKYKALNTTYRKFVKTISNGTILNLLEAVKNIKPNFNPDEIRPDMALVQHKIDSSYLSKTYRPLTAKQKQEFINLLNEKKVIDAALTNMQNGDWTDDWPYCGIYIIKNNNDTIRIETRRQVDGMLPWEINGVKTYDSAISKFVMACISNYPYSVSQRLLGSTMYEHISDYIQRTYTNDMFERERWDEVAPQNVELLKKHFTILQADSWNDNSGFTFLCKNLPGNVVVSGMLDIQDSKKIKQLIKFATDTLAQFIKTDNFLVKACRDTTGCTIRFSNMLGASNHSFNAAKGYDKTGYLRQFPDNEVLPFAIDMKGGSCANDWLYLPEGKLLLVNYCDDSVFGIPGGSLKSSGNTTRKRAFIFFTADGKYLGQNPGN